MAEQPKPETTDAGPRPILPIFKLEPKPHLVGNQMRHLRRGVSRRQARRLLEMRRRLTSSARFRSRTRAKSGFFR